MDDDKIKTLGQQFSVLFCRLKLVEDGSGGEAYYYGKLGEVVKTVRSIILAESDIRTYIWEADYDSWGRVNSMTYPDGEVVNYTYDKGGNLFSVKTTKDGEVTTLIESQRYDKYGNLTYRKMGNGAETSYTYDDKRLHLNQMSLICNGSTLMDNKYTYDNVDNILGIANAAKPASGDIGGASSHVYEYDAINRLISAQGSAKDQSYELQMRYDVMSNPLQKDSVAYEYETNNHPNAVSRAGSKIFKYDANGNPISIEDTTTNALRVMQWDEENRLQSLGDDGYVSRYTYNHAGERVVKSHGGTTVAYVNGAPQGVIWNDQDNWTAYVSPYMVVNGDRFTKHYYVGSQRIASKIGGGEFNNLYDASKSCVTAGQKDYAERVSLITQSRDDYNAALGIAPGPPTAKGIYGEAEYSGAYGSYAIKPLGNYDVPTGWPSKPYKRPYGGTPGAPVMYQKPSDPDDTGAGYGYSNAEGLSENDVYFYHSDHLGSTSYITDRDGNVSQFIAYKPFGELLIDEHAVSYDSPWKFNGKEWDSETGLYYYGARYYEPQICLWISPDPLCEAKPNMSPYNFVGNNPLNRIDPWGLTDYEVDGQTRTIDDGISGLRMNVSGDDFLRLQAYFNTDRYSYDQYMNGLSVRNGYTTATISECSESSLGYSLDVIAHHAGGQSYYEWAMDCRTPYSPYFNILSGSFTIAESFGNQFDKINIGNNGKWYFRQGNGRIFNGNQYVSVTQASAKYASFIKGIKFAGGLTSVLSAVYVVGNGYILDGNHWGYNAKVQTSGALGGAVGGGLGSYYGSMAGIYIGSFFGGIGAVPGAFIGGFVGGFFGSWSGGYVGEIGAKRILR